MLLFNGVKWFELAWFDSFRTMDSILLQRLFKCDCCNVKKQTRVYVCSFLHLLTSTYSYSFK